MTLTGDFKETIKARVQRDPAFREELIKEAIRCIHSGDVDTGKAVMRDYINATIGFEELGNLTHKSPKSLIQHVRAKRQPTSPYLVQSYQPDPRVRRRLTQERNGRDTGEVTPQVTP